MKYIVRFLLLGILSTCVSYAQLADDTTSVSGNRVIFSNELGTNTSLIQYDGTNYPGTVVFTGDAVSKTETGFEFSTQEVAMYRYAAMTTENEQIYVVATRTNVTAARVGTTITVTIPGDTVVLSMRVRWDGTLGSSFTLVLGTSDMSNTSLADRWGAVFQAYREDTGALIAGAQARLDVSNHDRLTIQGLWTGGINHLRFGF